jgi:hypothetical protein
MAKRPIKKTQTKTREASVVRAKYPRHSVEKALRIPRTILEQNAGKPCTPQQAASLLNFASAAGPFSVAISSATKYGLLERDDGKIKPTELARRIIRPTSTEDQIKAYREAVLKAPEIANVYNHYRGENLPDEETFFRNTVVETFGVPQNDYEDFKRVFDESLKTAELFEIHGDKVRVLDVSDEVQQAEKPRHKKTSSVNGQNAEESCFVMQPFADPYGGYYEKIFKPAIEKAGLTPVRADNEIFGTGKIIDQVWRGIQEATVLIAELSTRNANVFYELGLAHALEKPVVLISSNESDVPFDLHHIRVIYYDLKDPFWGAKLIDKISENIRSALTNPEEAIFKTISTPKDEP